MRYRIELILSFLVIAWLMAVYFSVSFSLDSPALHRELLY